MKSVSRQKAREIALWVLAADFPLLYTGAVTLESAAVTVVALAVAGLAAAVAAAVY